MIHALSLRTTDARAGERRVFDRVVAVVGREPILASELHARAKPFLARAAGASAGERAAFEERALKEVLDRMIADRLEAREAERQHVTVTPEEVTKAIENVARGVNLSVPAVYEEAERQGMSRAVYEEEVRRQLLEGKLVLALPGARKVRATDAEIDARLEQLRAAAKGATVERATAEQAVVNEKLERLRAKWIEGLRADVYIEVRL